MTYDPHDPAEIEEEAAWRGGRERYRADAWDFVIRDPRGRAVLADILLSTGHMAPTFVPGAPDRTAWLEGKRAIGLALHAKIALQHPQFLSSIEHQTRELMQDVRGGDRSGASE